MHAEIQDCESGRGTSTDEDCEIELTSYPQGGKWEEGSLVPRPPPFLPSVCVHNNTWDRKTGKKWGRPGRIRHVSGHEVDVGGEGPIFNYIRTKLKSEFLTGQDK